MFKSEKRSYRITGKTPILGSNPSDPNTYTRFIASKSPDPVSAENEADNLPPDADKGMTVFLRQPGTKALALRNYQVLGFLKGSADTLKAQYGIKQPASKFDKFVFVDPLFIPITRDGQNVIDEDDCYERPLRAMTMQGPRVTVASSEMVNLPWAIEFSVMVVENEKTEKSAAIDFALIEEMLNYGELKGLGQFRNGSFGQFTWERIK